ncbi:MAG: response regulator [Deltaproteobacteria bacterium]|nr:response regulator [Deltaproteobacteria bacterium]MBW1796304.1 response regulator [Deltaproteobacteria bacterium]
MSYTPRILIVDDEPRMRDSLKALLSGQGYEIHTGNSVKEAIEYLSRNSFDLVLLDIVMPEMDGHRVMDYINSRDIETSVIVMTGHASIESAIEAMRGGAYDYLRKPFEHEELLKTVGNALKQKRLKNKREQAEEALRESEEKYRAVLEACPDPIVVYDMEGAVIYLNPAFTQVFGWTPEKLLGKKIDYVPEENWPETRMMINRVLAGESFSAIESRRYTKQREILDVSISVATYLDRDGIPVGSVHTLRDITERKLLEAQLRQAGKMESIGTLAGGIAHDFNNLLMGIQGNVSLMLMDMDSTHPYHDRLKNIENQVQSGARLTSHLLGYARKGRYEVKPVDLNQLVEETSDTFGRTRKEISIHRELAEGLFAIEADQTQIEQVLLNLFVNAADAMSGGGNLILKTTNTTHKEIKGKLYVPKPGKYVLLTVIDTGAGMDKKTMERIFEPFFTTKEMGRGTGLGLASAYGIIKGHGGYIDVESRKGHGTTFSIHLPASQKRVRKAVKAPKQLIRRTGTVLLVDDEEVILEVGRELLEAMGYRVLLARDGKEAIEVYEKNQDDIDIVLLDMVMPNIGGGETYDRMKEINPNIKVLLSSGYSIHGEASEILERGCNGFIQKPFKIKELSGKIRDILE